MSVYTAEGVPSGVRHVGDIFAVAVATWLCRQGHQLPEFLLSEIRELLGWAGRGGTRLCTCPHPQGLLPDPGQDMIMWATLGLHLGGLGKHPETLQSQGMEGTVCQREGAEGAERVLLQEQKEGAETVVKEGSVAMG